MVVAGDDLAPVLVALEAVALLGREIRRRVALKELAVPIATGMKQS